MPRVLARSLVLAALIALPGALAAQQPATDVPETHTVKEGDTLWDLARQYYTDPLLWPRIYQMNTGVVEDPHWIYPGEVLRLKTEGAVTSVPTEGAPVSGDPAVVAAPVVTTTDSSAAEPAMVAAEPEAAVVAEASAPASADTAPVFPTAGAMQVQPVFRADFDDNFRAITRAEFYQAGFMTEGKSLTYGELLGPVAPTQVSARGSQAARLYSQVAMRPPTAGAYQVGDSIMAVWIDPRGFGQYGNIVVPVGMIRVTDVSRPEVLGEVVAQYNSMIPGMKLLPAEKFSERRGIRPQPIADGVEGTIIAFRSKDVLRGIQDIVMVDRGREGGVMPGDILEARRTIEPRDKMPAVIPEVVARLQVVHVGDKSATARVIWVQYPDIPVGTKWKVVARMPG
jgi:hypothetical protein